MGAYLSKESPAHSPQRRRSSSLYPWAVFFRRVTAPVRSEKSPGPAGGGLHTSRREDSRGGLATLFSDQRGRSANRESPLPAMNTKQSRPQLP